MEFVIIFHRTDIKASELQFGPFEEVEDEEVGLCDERALKPLVPAIVTFCDTTGAADFWANSVPTVQQSERTFKFETMDFKNHNDLLVLQK